MVYYLNADQNVKRLLFLHHNYQVSLKEYSLFGNNAERHIIMEKQAMDKVRLVKVYFWMMLIVMVTRRSF